MVEKCDSRHVGLRLKDTRKRRLVEAVPVIAKTVIYHCPGPGARNAKNISFICSIFVKESLR